MVYAILIIKVIHIIMNFIYVIHVNICPLCKSSHDKKHMIINYDDKNYICSKHNDEKFTTFCKICKMDICMLCEDEHKEHDIIDYRKILIKNDDIINSMKDLNDVIENFKFKINKMM